MRHAVNPLLLANHASFNPRTRVGCDCPRSQAQDYQTVSIHAPAWGATPGHDDSSGRCQFQSTHPRGVRPCPQAADRQVVPVSIHAPAWGATTFQTLRVSYGNQFQSTHPRGVRLGHLELIHAPLLVSIHAPAWGATWRSRSEACRRRACFNPRTRVGCDIVCAFNMLFFQEFQSTHPRGVRRGHGPVDALPERVSIHAPAWGATARLVSCSTWYTSFNPRTRVGCDTNANESPFRLMKCFNPRTRVGCDGESPTTAEGV